jgi:hypothetical protein
MRDLRAVLGKDLPNGTGAVLCPHGTVRQIHLFPRRVTIDFVAMPLVHRDLVALAFEQIALRLKHDVFPAAPLVSVVNQQDSHSHLIAAFTQDFQLLEPIEIERSNPATEKGYQNLILRLN